MIIRTPQTRVSYTAPTIKELFEGKAHHDKLLVPTPGGDKLVAARPVNHDEERGTCDLIVFDRLGSGFMIGEDVWRGVPTTTPVMPFSLEDGRAWTRRQIVIYEDRPCIVLDEPGGDARKVRALDGSGRIMRPRINIVLYSADRDHVRLLRTRRTAH